MRWGKHGHFTIERAKASFMKRVVVAASGCWNWTGAKQKRSGYGILGLAGRGWLAHRAAWFLFKGEDPGEHYVCHHCDNPSCVNPNHLELADQLWNVRDMESKGRSIHPSREDHGRAKLCWDDVHQIRSLHTKGVAIRAIARLYPLVDRTTIASVVHRRTWQE